MRRFAYLFLALLLGARPAGAQGVSPLSGQPGDSAGDNLVTFDPQQMELRWVNNNWELAAGGVVLKNFGPHHDDAWQALRLIRTLHLTQHGTVGAPRPIMEYWLSGGQAPQGFAGGLRVVPLDAASLRVEQIQGQWCVRDKQRVLFNFGGQQAEAGQALAIIRRYGFVQIGYIGWPTPLMMYFLGGAGSLSAAPPTSHVATPQPQPAGPSGALKPAGPDRAAVLQRQCLASGVHQLAPPQTSFAAVIHFNPGRLEVTSSQGLWQLVYGPHVLARFASQQEAHQAQAVVRSYGFTEQYRVGGPAPVFSYFLVHGQAPLGLHFGVPSVSFQPARVTVKQFGKDWMLCDGDQPLVDFGEHRAAAQEVARVIQRFHFDRLCRIGPTGPLSMTFLVKTR